MQALLSAGLHRYADTGEVAVGTYLRLERFGIESRSLAASSGAAGSAGTRRDGGVKGKEGKEAKGKREASGRMVCLIIESMVPVGWNRTLLAMAGKWEVAQLPGPRGTEHEEKPNKNDPGQMEAERLGAGSIANALTEAAPTAVAKHHGRAVAPDPKGNAHGLPMVLTKDETTPKAVMETQHANPITEDIDISDDDFEVMPVSQGRSTTQQGETSHDAPNRNPEPSKYPAQLRQPETKPVAPKSRPAVDEPQTGDPSDNPGLLPTDHPSPFLLPKPPVRMTLLKAIPSLPYKQNWSVNVLAVVSAITPVEPASLPPSFAQRQVRLADPTTPKHVLLTVFLDPDKFEPEVGSVVLLLGVKNHMFDGGSLKKYATDRAKGSENVARVLATADRGAARGTNGGGTGGGGGGSGAWWFENPTQFAWCDVAGLRRWWDSQS